MFTTSVNVNLNVNLELFGFFCHPWLIWLGLGLERSSFKKFHAAKLRFECIPHIRFSHWPIASENHLLLHTLLSVKRKTISLGKFSIAPEGAQSTFFRIDFFEKNAFFKFTCDHDAAQQSALEFLQPGIWCYEAVIIFKLAASLWKYSGAPNI